MKCKCGAEINPCSPFMDCHKCRSQPPEPTPAKEGPQCDAGCMTFTGGDRRHTKTCPFYPESVTKMLDDVRELLRAAEERLEISFNFERQNESLQARVAELEKEKTEHWRGCVAGTARLRAALEKITAYCEGGRACMGTDEKRCSIYEHEVARAALKEGSQ